MRVQDVMTRDVMTVTPSTELKDAALLLFTNHISGLPVVEGGRLLGVLSETDIVGKETSGHSNGEVTPDEARHLRRDRRATTAGEAMTTEVMTVEPWVSIWAAADLMVVHRVNRLPVVNEAGTLVGIVTRDDLVRAFARSDRDVERDIREHLLPSVGLGDRELEIKVEDGHVTVRGEIESKAMCDCLHASVRLIPGVVDVDWEVGRPAAASISAEVERALARGA
jgi:CBS domain-containing protein